VVEDSDENLNEYLGRLRRRERLFYVVLWLLVIIAFFDWWLRFVREPTLGLVAAVSN
jgi:hypothetical protein